MSVVLSIKYQPYGVSIKLPYHLKNSNQGMRQDFDYMTAKTWPPADVRGSGQREKLLEWLVTDTTLSSITDAGIGASPPF